MSVVQKMNDQVAQASGVEASIDALVHEICGAVRQAESKGKAELAALLHQIESWNWGGAVTSNPPSGGSGSTAGAGGSTPSGGAGGAGGSGSTAGAGGSGSTAGAGGTSGSGGTDGAGGTDQRHRASQRHR